MRECAKVNVRNVLTWKAISSMQYTGATGKFYSLSPASSLRYYLLMEQAESPCLDQYS